MAGGSCVPHGLYGPSPREFWCERHSSGPREFSGTGSARRDGRHAKLRSSFPWWRSCETKQAKASSRRWDVVLSGGSDGRFEAGHGDDAHRPGARFRSGVRFHLGENSTVSFHGIYFARLAERQRHTPRNPAASHLEITPEDCHGVPLMASPSVDKTTFDFLKEKIHEED